MTTGEFTVKEIVLDIRDSLKELAHKLDRIDREGSIGTKAELDDHENRLRQMENAFTSYKSRQYGMVSMLAFILPVLATISWHLWG